MQMRGEIVMKKILLFTFIMLLTLSIGTVSAEKNDNTLTSDIINQPEIINENIQNNDNIILYSENNASNSQQ